MERPQQDVGIKVRQLECFRCRCEVIDFGYGNVRGISDDHIEPAVGDDAVELHEPVERLVAGLPLGKGFLEGGL